MNEAVNLIFFDFLGVTANQRDPPHLQFAGLLKHNPSFKSLFVRKEVAASAECQWFIGLKHVRNSQSSPRELSTIPDHSFEAAPGKYGEYVPWLLSFLPYPVKNPAKSLQEFLKKLGVVSAGRFRGGMPPAAGFKWDAGEADKHSRAKDAARAGRGRNGGVGRARDPSGRLGLRRMLGAGWWGRGAGTRHAT